MLSLTAVKFTTERQTSPLITRVRGRGGQGEQTSKSLHEAVSWLLVHDILQITAVLQYKITQDGGASGCGARKPC